MKKRKKKEKRAKKEKVSVICGACHHATEFDGPNCHYCGMVLALAGYEKI